MALLNFDGAAEWAKAIEAETGKDLTTIKLAGKVVTAAEAKQSAAIVAETLVNGKMRSLEDHSLGEIQNWHNEDEKAVRKLRSDLTTAGALPTRYASGFYAAHVVAAAVTAAGAKNGDVSLIFNRMGAVLKAMHARNPSWGPLYVVHPGNMCVRRSYFRGAGEASGDEP